MLYNSYEVNNMDVVRLIPSFKTTLWAGNGLNRLYSKNCPKKTGESWELSCNPAGCCLIDNGAYGGKTLQQALQAEPDAVGTKFSGKRFSLLVKILDAGQDLSVQVHPTDSYASSHPGTEAKTEMWYIIHAEPGAEILCGLNRNVTATELSKAAANGTITGMLNRIMVKPGDGILIKAGTLHAIGKGILLAEIQQNSDTTYRVYDYGRGRPLNLSEGIECADKTVTVPEIIRDDVRKEKFTLCTCDNFRVGRFSVSEKALISTDPEAFMSVTVLRGRGIIDGMGAPPGATFFIPAGTDTVISGNMDLLLAVPR